MLADRDALVGRLRAAGCVYAEEEADLLAAGAGSAGELAEMAQRRIAGEPLEHLLGWAEFCGRRIAVGPGVFVPRVRTGLLVDAAAAVTGPAAAVVELCCGSGAISAVLAGRIAPRWLAVTEVDPAAVGYARRNLAGLGAEVFQGDLFTPLPPGRRGRLDLVVANAPYVPTDALALLPPEARLHEARVALDGGPDGLAVLRRVSVDAAGWLAPGGHLVVEVSQAQSPTLCAAMAAVGLAPQVVRDDDRDAVAVTARKPA